MSKTTVNNKLPVLDSNATQPKFSDQLDTGTGGFTLDEKNLYTFDLTSIDSDDSTNGSKGTWEKGNINVDNERKDISKGTKRTLADYLGKLTKNSSDISYSAEGSESTIYKNYGKGNYYPIAANLNEQQKEFLSQEESAVKSKNSWAIHYSDILANTNVSTADDPVTKLKEKKGKNSPGYEPGTRSSENVDTINGHELLKTTKPNSPVAKYSKALINNRFSSTNNYENAGLRTPQFLSAYKKGVSAKQEDIQNDGVSFSQLAQIGSTLSARASGELTANDPDIPYEPTNSGADILALAPGLSQAGLRVSTEDFNVKALLSILDKSDGITEFDLIKFDDESWGALNNVLDRYGGLGALGMGVLAVLLTLALLLIVEFFLLLTTFFSPKKRGRGNIEHSKREIGSNRAPYGRFYAVNDSSDFLSKIGFTSTENEYKKCVEIGAYLFFKLGNKKITSSSSDNNLKMLYESSGWASIMSRTVIRSFTLIYDGLTDFAKKLAGGNVLAAASILLNLYDLFRSSKFVKCINIFASLGDSSIKNSSVFDAKDEIASSQGGGLKFSLIDKIAAANGNNQTAWGSRLNIQVTNADKSITTEKMTLTWANHRAPDTFIMPSSWAKAAFNRAGYMFGAPIMVSKLNTLKNAQKSPYVTVDDENSSRISTPIREYLEKQLESEYLPFYFHDVRTNEIVSFHAFHSNLTDDYHSNYDSLDAVGRVEAIKTYKSTSRKISLAFTIASTSEEDFNYMWLKINKLTTLLYPQFNKGKKIVGGKPTDESSYILTAPFSQQVMSPPLVRLRIGDLIQSNYSKFALARLFGFGNEGNTVSGKTMGTQQKTAEEIEKQKTALFNSAKTDKSYQWAITDKMGEIPVPFYTKPSDGSPKQRVIPDENLKKHLYLVFDNIIEPTAPEGGSAVVTAAKFRVKVKESSIDYVSKLNYEFTDEITGIAVDLVNLTELTEISKEKFEAQLDLFADPYYGDMRNFMDDSPEKGNVVARSFRSVGGKGLPGFIESMQFDWQNQTVWNNVGTGKEYGRAPRMCKVTISFSPIHDIVPGLDHTGMNRAPIYPIGLMAPNQPPQPPAQPNASSKGSK